MSVATAVILIELAAPLSARAAECGTLEQQTGGCPTSGAEIGHGGVDVSATDGRAGTSAGAGSPRQGGGAPAIDPVTDPVADPGTAVVRPPVTVICIPNSPCDPNFTVQLSDLVSFRPTTPVAAMEPRGWMVVGLDTNFIARSAVEVQGGLLLGYQADVRFRPARYAWSYGDGTSAVTSTAGATWHELGLPEFSKTGTSHVYRAGGTYTIELRVGFTAEYRFGGSPWRVISGTLFVPANRLTALAGEATTVLVARDCTGNPSGPGC
ncbi:MAG: hypothetical protein QOE16_2229 [Microbacteriaceae bacterium]|nr:hypothetical protein [Microbacteriaceae bacterium]